LCTSTTARLEPTTERPLSNGTAFTPGPAAVPALRPPAPLRPRPRPPAAPQPPAPAQQRGAGCDWDYLGPHQGRLPRPAAPRPPAPAQPTQTRLMACPRVHELTEPCRTPEPLGAQQAGSAIATQLDQQHSALRHATRGTLVVTLNPAADARARAPAATRAARPPGADRCRARARAQLAAGTPPRPPPRPANAAHHHGVKLPAGAPRVLSAGTACPATAAQPRRGCDSGDGDITPKPQLGSHTDGHTQNPFNHISMTRPQLQHARARSAPR